MVASSHGVSLNLTPKETTKYPRNPIYCKMLESILFIFIFLFRPNIWVCCSPPQVIQVLYGYLLIIFKMLNLFKFCDWTTCSPGIWCHSKLAFLIWNESDPFTSLSRRLDGTISFLEFNLLQYNTKWAEMHIANTTNKDRLWCIFCLLANPRRGPQFAWSRSSLTVCAADML